MVHKPLSTTARSEWPDEGRIWDSFRQTDAKNGHPGFRAAQHSAMATQRPRCTKTDLTWVVTDLCLLQALDPKLTNLAGFLRLFLPIGTGSAKQTSPSLAHCTQTSQLIVQSSSERAQVCHPPQGFSHPPFGCCTESWRWRSET